jgi:hypothetical protein
MLFIISCVKTVPPTPIAPKPMNIFNLPQNAITNGEEIQFTLKTAGTYTLTMVDSIQNTVVTREKFLGVAGTNKLNIYTRAIQSKYLYLLLEDSTKAQIAKTTLIIN